MEMKKNKFVCFVICFLSIILVNGCNSELLDAKEPSSLSTVASQTLISFTATPTFTLTSTAMITNTPTPTQTATITPTPIPTLSREARYKYWLGLMETNGGCELPCWWGIHPGESEWEDLNQLYAPTGIEDITVFVEDGIFWTPESFFQPGIADIIKQYFGEGEIIEDISIFTDLYTSRNRELLAELVSRYSIESVFLSYGIPSRIQIYFPPGRSEPNAPWIYQIWVYYDNLGILVFNEIENISLNPNTGIYNICINFEDTHSIHLYLQSPNDDKPLEVVAGRRQIILANPPKSFEDAATITIEEFYNKVIDPNQANKCFESPENLWP